MTARIRTTAENLGQYRKELVDNGIYDELADMIVRDAAMNIHADGGFDVKPISESVKLEIHLDGAALAEHIRSAGELGSAAAQNLMYG